ncbi:MAG: PAS domain S-box protein [Candidatus Binatia bacterium]
MTVFQNHTILNVDDSEAGRYAKSRILQRAGYRVIEAATGAAALQRITEVRPELILLDIKLPDINGLEVCRAIKSDPSTADIMVLQISALKVSAADRVHGLAVGADAYLTEPIEPEELLATSQALLRLHERERENRRLLAELAESEAEFRASFEATSVAMGQADPLTGRMLKLNRCFRQMLGYSEPELLGRPFPEITHPDDREQNFAEFLRLGRGEITEYRCDKRYVRKDGGTVWADVTVNLVRDGEGRPVRTVAVVHDITERKQAEAAQRESEERFRKLANLMPQIAFTADASGRVDFVNRQWTEYTGEPDEVALADDWDAQIHPDDRERVRRLWREAIDRGIIHETEFRLRGKDGIYRWNLSRSVPVRDEREQVLEWFGTCTDIDSSKRLQEALRENEERLRLTVEAARFGTYDVDIDKDEIYCSPELREICGLDSSAPLAAQAAVNLVHVADRKAASAKILQALSAEGSGRYEAEFRIVRPDGGVRWVIVRGRGYFAGDGEQRRAVRGLGTVSDITSRKRAEEQLRMQNERLELLAKTAEQLLTADDPSGMMDKIFATVQEHLGLDAYLNYRLDENAAALVIEAAAGIPEEFASAYQRLEIGQAFCGTAAQTGEPVIAESLPASADPKAELAKQSGFRAYACHPLIVGERLLGTLSFASKHRDRFESDEIEFMRTICHYVSTAKERLRLLEEANRQTRRLARNELRLQLALDTASVGIYEWDLRHVQTLWDERLLAHWGVRRGAPVSSVMFMRGIQAGDRATAQAAMERAFDPAGDCAFFVEFRVSGIDDGIERWIATRGQVFHEQGRPAQLLGTTCDISERKRAEIELLSLRDRLAIELADMTRLQELSTRLLIENDLEAMLNHVLTACMELLGADKGNVQLFDESEKAFKTGTQRGFNQQFFDYFKSVRAGSTVWDIALKQRRRVVIEDVSKEPEIAELVGVFAEHGVRAMQSTPIFGHDGRVLCMLSTHFAEPHRPSERELRLLDLYAQQAERVIERKQAEDALRKSEERLALALEASNGGVWDFDLLRNSAVVSESFRTLYGFTTDEPVTYEKWLSRLDREDRKRLARYNARLFRAGTEFNFEYRIRHPERGERWLAAIGRIVRDGEGRPARLIGVNTDITGRKRSEVARAQLAAIVESSEDAIFSIDLAGIVTTWNRGAERLYGYSAAEVLGEHVDVLIPNERRHEVITVIQRVARGQPIDIYETVRWRKDGSDVNVSLSVSPIRNDQGTIIGVSKITRDISARMLAEETLWHSQQQLSLAQEAAHVGIWDWDPRTGKLSWTAEMLNLYGVTHPVQNYGEWRQLVHVDDVDRVEAERYELIRQRRPFNVEYRVMHGSGEVRWIASRGQGWYGDDGELTRVLGINMDITERKRAETQLHESEQRFKALADSAPVLIWIAQPQNTQFCNQAYRDFVGVSDDSELVGSGWMNFLHPEDSGGYVSAYRKAAEQQARFEADFRMRRFDGEYRWMKTLATPRFTDGGAFLGYAGCTLDVHDRKIAEAQVGLLAAVVNSAQDAIYSFTLDSTMVSWNRAAEQLFGWSEEEVLGRSSNLFVPPELTEERNGLLELILRGEPVTRFETVRLRRDGSRFDVSLTFSPVMAQGKIIAISATARDITELRRAQHQRDQQARLLDLSLDAIIVWNRATGAVEYWNEGAEKLYGYSAGEVIGRSIEELLKSVYPVLQADIAQKIDGAGEWDGRVLHTQKSGGQIAVLSRKQKVARPGSDVILEVNRDITSIEEAEQAVAEAAVRLKAIVQTAVDGIITIDQHGAVESLNPAAEKIFGYAAAEVIGREIGLLMPELSAHFGAGALASYLRNIDRETIGSGQETRGRRKNGSEFPVEFGVSETVLGEARFYTGLVRDATARKQAEHALVEAKNAADAASRAKSEFLANMSHEIRNPMTGIMGYADILLERLRDQGAIECVRTIKDSGQYLLQIINDLLDLAKIEAQGLQLEKESVHLPTFLTDVYTLMEGAARAKALPLSLKYDGVIPYKIESDAKRLRQILINLLGNAIKFTDHGGVELAVHFDPAQAELQFHISDSGIGMTQEQQQNLFRPFTQGDSSMTKTYGGTGLGLAITKRLVEALGGHIGVDSLPERGSTFHVTLPVRVLSGGAFRNIEMDSKSPPLSWQRKLAVRVMIVEDQPDIRRLMEYFISAAGGSVKTFSGGEAALEAIEEHPNDFDVVLMDIQMPRLDGYETTRRMRALEFTKPIIAVTAGAMAGDQANCLAAGCSDYVSKPIDMTLLLEKIAGVASSRQSMAKEEQWREPGLWDDANSSGAPPGRSAVDRSTNRRVLVVDDRPVALNATKSLLEMHGFEVRGAATGNAALRIAGEFRPDFVFLDISLPDISGYEVFRQLKSSERLAQTKFIALSGHGREESLRARKAGFDAYMTKPVDIREMEKLVTGTLPLERQ